MSVSFHFITLDGIKLKLGGGNGGLLNSELFPEEVSSEEFGSQGLWCTQNNDNKDDGFAQKEDIFNFKIDNCRLI